jgi:NADH-quinone oxidoreductase subunit E
MLSEREKALILEEVKKLPESHRASRASSDKRAAVSGALMILQESRGWVSDESIRDIAQELQMSAEEVDGIATFYELVFRRRVGSHVILFCDGVSCAVTGAERILSHLANTLGIEPGETTADGLFTLLPAGCLGVCEKAPVMTIDGKVFGNLTEEGVEEALSRYRGGKGAGAAHV